MARPYGPNIDYLNSLLGARGPDAVPYSDTERFGIRDHVAELQKVFPTLGCKVEQFHGNDGRTLNLLKVDGTIPIHFQGAKYNIPIVAWMLEQYPYQAPLIYVVPTATMVIKSPHSCVDRNGQVTTPSLRGWQYPTSNLVDAVLEMSHMFGSEPPLYSQPAGGVRPPPPQQGPFVQPPTNYPSYMTPPVPGARGATPPQQQQQQGGGYGRGGPGGGPPPPPPPPSAYPAPSGNSASDSMATNPIWGAAYAAARGTQDAYSNNGGGAGGGGRGAAPSTSGRDSAQQQQQQQQRSNGYAEQQQQQQQQQQQRVQPPAQAAVSAAELESQFRSLALDAVSRQLQAAGSSYARHCEAETAKALEVQRALAARSATLQGQREALRQERMGTEGVVADMGGRTRALTQWLERNEGRAVGVDPAALDMERDVFVAADALSRQALAAQAEDLGVEDTILALDKALHSGVLPLEAYTKQVRALCRRQFFARALGLRVAAAQQAQAPAASSSQQQGGPPPPRQLQHPPQLQRGGQQAPAALTPYPLPHGDSWTNTGILTNPLSSRPR